MSVSLSTLFRYAAQNECVPVFEATYMCLLEFPWPLRYFSRLRLVIILTRVCFGSDSSPCQEIHFGNREYF